MAAPIDGLIKKQWRAVSDDYSYIIEDDATGENVGCIWSETNAHLIVAAPDMLGALIWAKEALRDNSAMITVRDRIDTAIAKATGTT